MKKLILAMLLLSCESRDLCEIDPRFTAKFYNCISILAVREAGIYTHHDTWDAYQCLTSITKVKSYMDVDSDTPLSYTYSDTVNYFCLDLQAWLKWYEGNKCGYTLEHANSVLGQDSLKWPRDLNEFYLEDMGCIIHELK